MLVFAFASSVTVAQEPTNANTDDLTIQSVENWVSSEALFIKTSDNIEKNPAGCSITDRYLLPSGSSTVSRSMILAAYSAGQKVQFTIYNGDCVNDRPQIVAVKYVGS